MFTKTALVLTIVLGAASGALGAAKKQYSANPAWDVYDSRGIYIGSDPDSLIRQYLMHDHGNE